MTKSIPGRAPSGISCVRQAMIDVADVKPGQKVLIHAGAGGVGTFAVQFARHLGAYVATTASKAKHELVGRWARMRRSITEIRTSRPC